MLTGFLLGIQFSCVAFSIGCLYSSIKEEKIKQAKWRKLEDFIIELRSELNGK